MNVLLVRPQYHSHHRPAGFPIGIGYLAAVLRHAGHAVRLLDLVLSADWEADLTRMLMDENFDLLGISCMSVQFQGACQTGRLARKLRPHLPIVMGGAHPSITPAETLGLDFVDFVIRGEGEMPLLDLVAAMCGQRPFAEAGSLSYCQGTRVIHNQLYGALPAPDEIPMPAYDLLPMERYFQMEIPGFPTLHPRPFQIFTSRGCPYQCIYCHDLFGKRFRPRSPENVLSEMRHLYDRYGVREFLIYDDNFTFDQDRARRICQLILESGMRVGLQFPNGIRADRVDDALLEAMTAAGTHSITIGIESGSPRVQKMIRKGLSLEKVTAFLRQAHGRGLVTHGSFIIGFPGETVRDVLQTIRYARRSELDFAFFAFATPYPGTELYSMVMEQGLPLRLLDDAMDVTTPHIRTAEMSTFTLRLLFVLAYLLVYTRPRRLLAFVRSLFQDGMLRKYITALQKYLLPAVQGR
jgi:anaerobic magnesium-protoporphyrin IX monomethyl ester cyclase